jgi:archaemetzincin
MQGTARIPEDHRQPPYSCPVDLAKVLIATGADQTERYKALLTFCEKKSEDRMFAAYAAWIRALLEAQKLSR